MPRVSVTVGGVVSSTPRARQLESMFDVPRADRQTLSWQFDAPYEERDWNIGLIVGPSGSGKSTILRDQFGVPRSLDWSGASVIDAFDKRHSLAEIASVCQAVGFNTIPAWLRPHHVLSNGEQFRAEMARLLLDATIDDETVVLDEFTSVVDRQVAKIAAHAVAKFVRKRDLSLVAATCHYDVIDWLSPDWVIEPAERRFSWRSVQPRPRLDVTISPVSHAAWRLFAPFHYLTNELHRAARCYCLFVDDVPAAFAGVLYRPHARASGIWGVSRLVTLPDWQGLGLAFTLVDTLGGAYKAIGQRLHTYPAHPALIRSFDRSKRWQLRTRPGFNISGSGTTSSVGWRHGTRPCAVFGYVGDALDVSAARRLTSAYHAQLHPASRRDYSTARSRASRGASRGARRGGPPHSLPPAPA